MANPASPRTPSQKWFNHDNPAETDLLGRDKFAKEVAERIVHNFPNGSDGFVMGVTGRWGSGKSTFLKYLQKHIQKAHAESIEDRLDPTFIEFYPWLYNGQKELQAIFLKEVALKSGNQSVAFKKFFNTLAERLILPKLISNFSFEIPGIGRTTINNLEEVFKDNLDDLKKDVNTDLISNKRKLYILLDDIDRLEPQSIIEILQLIRSNTSFKNTTYILAYDKEYVFNALKNKYAENGVEYLDKIIQLDYALPEPNEDKIQHLFFEELAKIKNDLNLDISEKAIESLWKIHEMKSFFPTLRSVYRYFNSLRFRLPAIHTEITIEDFMILEVFRMFHYELYQDILRYTTFSKYSNKWSEFMQTYKTERVGSNKLLDKLKDMQFYQERGKKSIERRFIDSRYTARYFALEIDNKDVSNEDLEYFLLYPEKRTAILSESMEFGRIENLLRALQDSQLSEKFKIKDTSIFNTLVDYWFEHPRQYTSVCTILFSSLINACNISANREEAFFAFINSFYMNKSRFNPAVFHLMYLTLNYFPSKDPSFKIYRRYFESEKQALLKFYNEYITNWEHLFIPDIYKQPYNSIGILFLKEYATRHTEKYELALNDILKKPENVIELLNALTIQSSGLHPDYIIDWHTKATLISATNENNFWNKLQEIDNSEFGEYLVKRIDYYLTNCDTTNPQKTLEYLQRELKGRRNTYGEVSIEAVDTLKRMGKTFFSLKNYVAAIEVLKEAILTSQQLPEKLRPSMKETEKLITQAEGKIHSKR